jgi:hypothetical protein
MKDDSIIKKYLIKQLNNELSLQKLYDIYSLLKTNPNFIDENVIVAVLNTLNKHHPESKLILKILKLNKEQHSIRWSSNSITFR